MDEIDKYYEQIKFEDSMRTNEEFVEHATNTVERVAESEAAKTRLVGAIMGFKVLLDGDVTRERVQEMHDQMLEILRGLGADI